MGLIIKRQDFLFEDQVLAGHLIFKPPFKASSAMQDEARFVHVVHGRSRLYSPNNKFDLQSGDSLLMKCANFVNNWFENEDDQNNEVFIINFNPQLLKLIYEGQIPEVFSRKQSVPANPVEIIQPNELMENFIASFSHYLEQPQIISPEFLKIKVRELIMILIHTDRSGQLRNILSDLFQTKEYEFKEIVHSHLYEDLKIEDLAFFAGLSLSSFKRKFKTVFGTSPTRYIKTKRLEKAVYLLKNPQLRISDVAYDCGFNDIGYFSKVFHATFQSSPSEYRKKMVS